MTEQTNVKAEVEKKSKEQVEMELKAERARKKALKATRKLRRYARRQELKKLGFRPNRKMTADKKTGKFLVGFFVDGKAELTGTGRALTKEELTAA